MDKLAKLIESLESLLIKVFRKRYEVTRTQNSYSTEQKNVKAGRGCMAITFRNQGDVVAYVMANTSGAAKVKLKVDQERTYSVKSPRYEDNTKWTITFAAGSGTKDCLVEREYVREITKDCKNDD